MSKGSWYRKVNKKKYDENYDRIFCKHDWHIYSPSGGEVCTKCAARKGENNGMIFGGSKDVGSIQEDIHEETTGESTKEATPFKSSDPILRSLEADNRRG